jgi:homocysteine S-methyltransferase
MTVTVLDGGLATELEARGHDLSDRLWSARLLLTDPEAIEEVHLAYYRAGARVATTASYQATVPGLTRVGLDRPRALATIRLSARLAQRARERYREEIGTAAPEDGLLVAGSIGPYGAMLADGSEYLGDYDPGPAAMRDLHAPRIEALLDAGVDLIAFETIPTVREAQVLVDLLVEAGARGWLSYQCRDERSTAAGEPIEEAVSIVDGIESLVAVGLNCTSPRHVSALLTTARAATDRPLIAYPNGGDRWDPRSRHWLPSDDAGGFDPVAAAGWRDLGVAWLGGCCGTGPADISALTAAVAG